MKSAVAEYVRLAVEFNNVAQDHRAKGYKNIILREILEKNYLDRCRNATALWNATPSYDPDSDFQLLKELPGLRYYVAEKVTGTELISEKDIKRAAKLVATSASLDFDRRYKNRALEELAGNARIRKILAATGDQKILNELDAIVDFDKNKAVFEDASLSVKGQEMFNLISNKEYKKALPLTTRFVFALFPQSIIRETISQNTRKIYGKIDNKLAEFNAHLGVN